LTGSRRIQHESGGGHGEGVAVVGGIDVEQEGRGDLRPFGGVGIAVGAATETAAQHGGVDDARVERHGGEAGREFLRQRLGEAFHRPFGGAIGGHFGIGGAAPAGTEIHDDAAPAPDHGRDEVPDDVGDALDVDVDDLGEFVRGDLPEGGVAIDEGGVVQQQVGRAVAGQNHPGPGGDLAVVGHVDDAEVVRRGELLLQGGDFGSGAAAADDHVAKADEFPGEGASAAARDAGDQDDSGDFRHDTTAYMLIQYSGISK